EAVFAHHGDRVTPTEGSELQGSVFPHGEQPVPLHSGDSLTDGGAALVEALGDPGTQRRHALLVEFEDRAQVHVGGVHEIMPDHRYHLSLAAAEPSVGA